MLSPATQASCQIFGITAIGSGHAWPDCFGPCGPVLARCLSGSGRSLLCDLLRLAVGREFHLVVAVHGDVEQVPVGVHRAVFRERPCRRPGCHRLIPFRKPLFDVFEVVDRPRRILLVSGGSGITPVMAMLRTLVAEGHQDEVAFVHYARSAAEACYRDELAALPGVRVLHGFTRSGSGDLAGRFGPDHLAAAMPAPDAVFVCGPTTLVEAVREHCDKVSTESFVPPVIEAPANPTGGRITFADSGIDAVDDGRSLLEQAESAGLAPANGCRMGICNTCTRRKNAGTVRSLTTGAVSSVPDEDIQICVSVPVGDVDLSL